MKTIELEVPCPICSGAATSPYGEIASDLIPCTLCGNQGYVTQARLHAYHDMIESVKRSITAMPGFTSFVSEDDQSSEPVRCRSVRSAPRWLSTFPADVKLHTPDGLLNL